MHVEECKAAQEFMAQCTFQSWGTDGTEEADLAGCLNENLQLGDLSSYPKRRLDEYC